MNDIHSSEKYIERYLASKVTEAGGLCIKLLTSQFIGLPDRMCLFEHQRIIFVELKSTGKKPTKVQCSVHKMLKNLGFTVKVIDSVALVDELINNI